MSGLKVIYTHINPHRCLVTSKPRDHWNKSNLAQGKTRLALKCTKGNSKVVILSKKWFQAKVQISAIFLGIKVVLRISLKPIHRVNYISEPHVCLCFFFLPLFSPAFVAGLIQTGPPRCTQDHPRVWTKQGLVFCFLSISLGIKGAGTPPGCHRGHLVSPTQLGLASPESPGSCKWEQHRQAASRAARQWDRASPCQVSVWRHDSAANLTCFTSGVWATKPRAIFPLTHNAMVCRLCICTSGDFSYEIIWHFGWRGCGGDIVLRPEMPVRTAVTELDTLHSVGILESWDVGVRQTHWVTDKDS